MRFWRIIACSLVSVALLAVGGAAGAQSDNVTPIGPETAEAVTLAQTLSGHELRVNDVAFSPDGAQLISGSDDLTAIVWDIAAGEAAWTITGQLNTVRSVDVTPDGRRALTTGFNNVAYLWDLPSETRGMSYQYPAAFNDGEFAPDGETVAFAVGDGGVRVYPVTDEPEAAASLVLSTAALRVEQVSYSPDGALIAAGTGFPEDRVWVWDVETGEAVFTLGGHEGTVHSVDFGPDGQRLASGGGDGQVIVWDVETGEPAWTSVDAHDGDVYGVAFNTDGSLLASVGFDGVLTLWDVEAGTELATLTPESGDGSLLTVAFSPDGGTLASAGDSGDVWLWRVG